MYHLCKEYHVRPANLGRDLYIHEYREANTRADELTHMAREGHTFYHHHTHFYSFEVDTMEAVACRGAYDGGVCSKGSGCGFWLQVGYLNKRHHEYADMVYYPQGTWASFLPK